MEGSDMGKEDRYDLKNNPISDFKIGLDTHSFNVSLASRFGVVEALIIQHSYYWYKCNEGNEDMTKDGHTWFYRSVSQIADVYPYLSVDKVRRAIDRLVENGILIKGNYNTDKFKKANWYSLSDDMISVMSGDDKREDRQNAKPFGKMPNHSAKCQLNYKKKDSNKEYKEEKDESFSKKDVYLPFAAEPQQEYAKGDKTIHKKEHAKELVDFWNDKTRDFPKVRKVSPDVLSDIDKLLKRGYSYEDMKKAIVLCNSLSDFYKGKEKGNTWRATFQWLIHNTKNKFDMILNGALHTSQEQQRIYQSIMEEGVESQSTKYIPYTEGYHLWFNENDGKYYFTGNIINLADGYTKDNRPNGAQVHQNGYTYTWDAEKKDWDVK